MKRPSFQWYPGDWLRSTDIRSCSVAARGLWIDMICLMHDGNPYGHLKVGDKVILPVNLAQMVGATLHETEQWLEELEKSGVFSRKNDCIICRRMIRDEKIRESRAKGGILGGNPALLNNKKVNLNANLKPTPASASASASASKPNLKTLLDLGVNEKIARDWLIVRKTKKAPLTETAIDDLTREALKAGISVSDAVTICAQRNWQSFKSEWNWKGNGDTPPQKIPSCHVCHQPITGGFISTDAGKVHNECYR